METSVSLETKRADRLADLYAVHAPKAGRLAYLLVGDPHVAEDLVQEAFVRVGSRLLSLKNPDAFEAYLSQTVLNLARGHIRKASSNRSLLQRLQVERRPDATLPDVSTRDQLMRALQALTYKQRAAIVLRFYLDLSEQQTAELLGCAVGTVKSLVFRGTRELRQQMGDEPR